MRTVLPKNHDQLPDIAASKDRWVLWDKDDTLISAIPPMIDWSNEQVQQNTFDFVDPTLVLTQEAYLDDWSQYFGGITNTQTEVIAQAWHNSPTHKNLPIVSDGPEAVAYLRSKFTRQKVGFAVLTADRAFAAKHIEEQLSEHYPGMDYLIFSGQYDDGENNHSLSKSDTYSIFRKGLRFVADDSPRNAQAAHQHKAHVAVPTYPWNRSHDLSAQESSGRLIRVNSIAEQRAVEFAERAISATR